MVFKTAPLCAGESINARANDGDIALYISRGGAVYKCGLKQYAAAPALTEPKLFMYCDEVAELPDGRLVERRNDRLKIKT